MLARNAESLYWIGRYVERADDTARILDVSVHQLLEDATVDPDRAARTLLGVLGADPGSDDPLDAWKVTELVGLPMRREIDQLRADNGLGPMGCSVARYPGRLRRSCCSALCFPGTSEKFRTLNR